MLSVRLFPLNLNESGDCKWLRCRPYFAPPSAEDKEEVLSDFCAIGEKNLGPHVLRLDLVVLPQIGSEESGVEAETTRAW